MTNYDQSGPYRPPETIEDQFGIHLLVNYILKFNTLEKEKQFDFLDPYFKMSQPKENIKTILTRSSHHQFPRSTSPMHKKE